MIIYRRRYVDDDLFLSLVTLVYFIVSFSAMNCHRVAEQIGTFTHGRLLRER